MRWQGVVETTFDILEAMKYAGLLALAALATQGQAVSNPPTPLDNIRAAVVENLTRQHDYTCLETVQRHHEGPADIVDDTLRLEVALVDNSELFAWPNSREFHDEQVNQLVTSGMFSNGSFGLYPRMLFFGNDAEFTPLSSTLVDGRNTLQYDFRMPVAKSAFHLQGKSGEATVGFHGRFLADAETLELRHLTLTADDIPPGLGITSVDTSVDYVSIPFGDETFLLPARSVTQTTSTATLDRNTVSFSKCRKFSGQSTLIFDDPGFDNATLASSPKEITIPIHTELPLTILSGIALETAAAGDEIRARLDKDLRQGRALLIPKGAIATGHILRLERHKDQYVLELSFSELAWTNGHATIAASLQSIAADQVARRKDTSILTIPRSLPQPFKAGMVWKTTR